jgi:heat shock protein HslJ
VSRWSIRSGIVSCVFLFLAACAAAPSGGVAPFDLANTRWTLVSVTEKSVTQTPVPGTTVTLEFQNDGNAGGNAGCNSFGGEYQLQGEIIRFSALRVTEKFCPAPGVMELEQAYLTGLQAAQLFQVRGDSLTITFADGKGRLVFNRI